jgi:hypothetical protein
MVLVQRQAPNPALLSVLSRERTYHISDLIGSVAVWVSSPSSALDLNVISRAMVCASGLAF